MELHIQIEHNRDGLAVFHGGLKCGSFKSVDRIFVQTEADWLSDSDLAGFAVGADDDVVAGHACDTVFLGVRIGGWVDDGDEAGLFVDLAGAEHGGVGGVVAGFVGEVLVIELPEVRHVSANLIVYPLSEDFIQCVS